VLTEEKLDDVGARLEHIPRKSLKRLAQETGVSRSSAVFPNLFVAADALYRMLIHRGPHKTQNGNFLYFTYHKSEAVTYNFTTLNVSFMTIKYCYKWSLFGRLRTYTRCEEHHKIKFNETKLSCGPLLNYSRTPGVPRTTDWEPLV
jgi:hypothetical protein